MKKNVLFIGDYRPANNYGSIATTESLLNLIEQNVDVNLKIIDRRSFDNPTPKNGFKERNSLKSKIRKQIPFFIRVMYRKFKSQCSKETYFNSLHIPPTYNCFEEFYSKITNGEILQYEQALLDWADIVFINGEGTIVNGTNKYGVYNAGGRYIIYMAWLSKIKYKKLTILVNHTVDPSNSDAYEMISKVYKHLDFIATREPLSLLKLNKLNITNACYIPDALFSYKPKINWEYHELKKLPINFDKPYICIGDSAGFKKHDWLDGVKWDVESFYSELIQKLKTVIPQIVFIDGYTVSGKTSDPRRFPTIERIIKQNNVAHISLANCNYHELAQVLSKSELFVSGRWHSSILSLLVNTPILLWGSDSHKTKALYHIIDYKSPYFETSSLPLHINDIVDEAKNILENKILIKKDLQKKVKSLSIKSEDNVAVLKEKLQTIN